MSIERTSSVVASSAQVDVSLRQKAPGDSASPVSQAEDSSTQVRLSKLTQAIQHEGADTAHDINVKRLEEIKSRMDAGNLPIDTDKIAQALLHDLLYSTQ